MAARLQAAPYFLAQLRDIDVRPCLGTHTRKRLLHHLVQRGEFLGADRLPLLGRVHDDRIDFQALVPASRPELDALRMHLTGRNEAYCKTHSDGTQMLEGG